MCCACTPKVIKSAAVLPLSDSSPARRRGQMGIGRKSLQNTITDGGHQGCNEQCDEEHVRAM